MSDAARTNLADDPPSRLDERAIRPTGQQDPPASDHVDPPAAHFARVAATFDRLRLLDGHDRAAALTTLRRDDPALAVEVAELLAHHDRSDPLLDAPLIRPGVSSRIGVYRLVQLLGEGGMGTVWLAEQEEPVRRQVALKLIKLGMDTRQVIRRFDAERQLLARMEHPGIARVLDAGATSEGRPYFVMELVRGERITDHADRRRLNIAERLRLFRHICAAVQHAHGKGVIHRDLKPSNILVTEIDGVAIPKVIDFGVAKVLVDPTGGDAGRSDSNGDRTQWTNAGQAIGTPDYMSPEQAGVIEPRARLAGTRTAGATAGDVDIRSDIWSLGVVLFELLTGTTPIKARSRDGSGGSSSLRERPTPSELTAPRPSSVVAPRRNGTTTGAQRDLAQRRGTEPAALRRLLRSELDWIVLRALQIDPARRYDTVAALSDDIARFLDNRPIAARPPAALYEASKFARRHLVALTAAVVVVLSLLIGLTTALYGLNRARSERDFAIDAQQREAALADRLRDELAVNLIERGRLAGYADNVALASSLLWDAHLANPDSRHARWALREMLMRHPIRMSLHYPGETPFDGAMLDNERLLVVGSGIEPITIDIDSGRIHDRFVGTTAEVRSLDLSPDRRRVITGDRDGAVRLWSVDERREVALLLDRSDGLPGGLVVARFLDDDRVIAGDASGAIHVISLSSPDDAQRLESGLAAIEQLLVHRRSGRIVAGDRLGTLALYDGIDRAPRLVPAHRGVVMSLAFHPDGAVVASGATDRLVRILDFSDGSEVRTLDPRNGSIRDLRFSADGADLLVLGWWRLDSFDAETFTRRELVAEGGWRLVQHADPARVAIVGRNRVHIRVWQLDPQSLLTRHTLPSGWIVREINSPCGSRTVAYRHSSAAGFDEHGATRWLVDLGDSDAISIAVSADGDRVAVGARDRRVRVFALEELDSDGFRSARLLREVDGYQPGPNRALHFLNTETLIMPTDANALVAVELGGGEPGGGELGGVELGGGELGGIDRTRAARRVLLEGGDFALPLMSISADAPVTQQPSGSLVRLDRGNEILMCVSSPDGRLLAAAQRGGLLHLIDLRSGDVRTVELETTNFSLAFTHDGRHLVSGGWTGIVSIFDVATMKRRHSQAHSALVTNIVMHPTDPDLFVSVSSDHTVRVWSVKECRNLFWLAPLEDTPLLAVGLDRNGATVTVAGSGGSVVSWPIALDEPFVAANMEFERLERAADWTID